MIERLKQNWKSGLTVSLVSIPLSVSLAVASEATPTLGIITAIWAGLIAALFGGSNYNIIGPTGALSGILAAYAITNGHESLAMLAIVTGVITLLAYAFKLEKFLVFVPGSTIQGFTVGVAFIIGLNQLNYALGLRGLERHEKFIDNIAESLANLSLVSIPTLIVFLVFLAGMFALLKLTPRIPGAILLAPVGILLGYLSQGGYIPLYVETLGQKFTDISPKLFVMPHFFWDSSLLSAGATVAIVAILETMISAKIADGMTKTKHNKRHEMFGLGVANIVSGLAGGIPATAALARTSLNVKSGANHKTSAVVNAICVALISFVFLRYFAYIPMAVIAAILVFVAARMVEVPHLLRLYKYDRKAFALAMLVAFFTIYIDPIIGILLGTAAALLVFVEKLSRGQFDLKVNEQDKGIVDEVSGEKLKLVHKSGDTLLYSIKGQLAYINSQSHIARFESGLNGYKNVILRLKELHFIDIDGIDALDEIIEIIESQGKKVLISGVNPYIATYLKQQCEHYQDLKKSRLVFEKTSDALRHLGYVVSKS